MTDAAEIFNAVRDALCPTQSLHHRYVRLNGVLEQVCAEHAAALSGDFSGLFSRLYAVCRAAGIDHHTGDAFRRSARQILFGRAAATEAGLQTDAARLCHFLSALYGVPVPADLPQLSAAGELPDRTPAGRFFRCLRGVVAEAGAEYLVCETPAGLLRVDAPQFRSLYPLLSVGQNVNLLETRVTAGCAEPFMLILEPDYLVDVSALTACLRPYGRSPYNYLLDRLRLPDSTPAILLGNAANAFMDDCINGDGSPDALYTASLARHFHDYITAYVAHAADIHPDFFQRAHRQFDNIYNTVHHSFPKEDVRIPRSEVLLEPAFICETLGLRGRFDVMTGDFRTILELKSGRAREFPDPRHPRPVQSHVLQMSLYKEILHFNLRLPREAVRTFLFYSAYPLLFDERSPLDAVRDCLALRNEIVAMELRLRSAVEVGKVLDKLSPELLNTEGMDNAFYHKYLLPDLQTMLLPLQSASGVEREYFCAFMAFLYREQFLAKTGDCRPGSTRGFARTWLDDPESKMVSGDLIPDLHICRTEGTDGVERIVFDLPPVCRENLPNFNVGEMVQCYERPDAAHGVTSTHLLRGFIEALDGQKLTLRLASCQRNRHLFSTDRRYAIEHDFTDAPMRSSMQGLYAFLSAPADRRDLLMARRRPRVDTSRCCRGTYPAHVADIVTHAKQALDYFLLVGPPGTGKTNVALRAMVQEFLLEYDAGGAAGGALLLMAYTNRAVDEICAMLESLMADLPRPADYVRVGSAQNCPAAYHHRLLTRQAACCRNRAEAAGLLHRLPIVVGTVATMSSRTDLLRCKRFAVAMIDEASQVLEPMLLTLLSLRREGTSDPVLPKFVMIGDHKQLPAVVLQRAKQSRVSSRALLDIGLLDLGDSLFARLHRLAGGSGISGIVDLMERQGRMHPDICRFVNHRFYGGRLRAVPLPHQSGPLQFPRSAATPLQQFVAHVRLGFLPVTADGAPGGKSHPAEAELVAEIVEALARLMGLWPCAAEGEAVADGESGTSDAQGADEAAADLPAKKVANGESGESETFDAQGADEAEVLAKRVGIIVPFRAQIAQIRGALHRRGLTVARGLTIDTVECYQGSQRDHIVMSTCVSRPYAMGMLSAPVAVEGTMVDRKLNVAVTRARKQFLLVGHPQTLCCSPLYAALIRESQTYSPQGDDR